MVGRKGKTSFVYCEKCGKKLLERQPNGVWRFRFGRIQKSDETVVDILFYGSLRFKCTRRTCGFVNVLNFKSLAKSMRLPFILFSMYF